MRNNLIVVGGSAGAKIVYNIAKNKYIKVFFYDSFWDGASPRILEDDFNKAIFSSEYDYFVATGDNKIRGEIIDHMKDKFKTDPCNILHPAAVIESTNIGYGNLILAGAFIGYDAKIGNGCIINTNSVCEHDCIIGDFSQVAPSATILGRVNIGRRVFIGGGATILPNTSVCDDVIIGAGSVVVNNLESKGVYFGAPAKQKGN